MWLLTNKLQMLSVGSGVRHPEIFRGVKDLL